MEKIIYFNFKINYLIKNFLIIAMLFCLNEFGLAGSLANSEATTIGSAAENILVPTSFLTEIIYNICYVVGGALVLGSIIQYRNHRNNPLQVRLSQPIMLLIFGLVLIAVPLLSQLSPASSSVSIN